MMASWVLPTSPTSLNPWLIINDINTIAVIVEIMVNSKLLRIPLRKEVKNIFFPLRRGVNLKDAILFN
jgi:hypothetical protein